MNTKMIKLDSKMIKLDREKTKKFAKERGISLEDISYALGRSKSYISYAMSSESGIPNATFDLLCRIYDVPPETFLPDPEPVVAPPGLEGGYLTEVFVHGNKVHFAVRNNGEEVASAFAYIKNDTELAVMQAISYAAHMCYKFAQQKSWK